VRSEVGRHVATHCSVAMQIWVMVFDGADNITSRLLSEASKYSSHVLPAAVALSLLSCLHCTATKLNIRERTELDVRASCR
jgi:hypothetical protein